MIEHLSKASAALLTCLIWIPVASALDVKRPDVRAFIDAGSVAGLDTACIDSIRPAPFFLSFSGSAP